MPARKSKAVSEGRRYSPDPDYTWYLDKENGMSDPDGYLEMSPEEILSDLFK